MKKVLLVALSLGAVVFCTAVAGVAVAIRQGIWVDDTFDPGE